MEQVGLDKRSKLIVVVVGVLAFSAIVCSAVWYDGLQGERKIVEGKITITSVPSERSLSYFIIRVDTGEDLPTTISVFDFDFGDYCLLRVASDMNRTVRIEYHTYQYSATGTADWLDDIQILDEIPSEKQ